MSINLRRFLIGSAVALFSIVGHAAERMEDLDIPPNFIIEVGESKSIQLPQPKRIRKLVIDAQGVTTNSMIEVVVNNEVKGTIFAPGADPVYVVTVGEIASQITFRHLSGGAMQVLRVQSATNVWTAPDWSLVTPEQSGAMVRDLATVAIETVENLKMNVDPKDFADHLLAIKIAAGRVFVMTNGHGPVSDQAKAAMVAMSQAIKSANSFLSDLLSRSETFEDAVTLLTVREATDDLLN